LAVAIAFTKRFTWQADLVTALGIALIVLGRGAVALRGASWLRPPAASFRGPGAYSAAGVGRGTSPEQAARVGRAAGAWATAAGAVIAFELVALFGHPRRTHPTISSYVGSITAHDPGKGLLFAVWLALGWWAWSGLGPSSRQPDNG